MAPAKMDAIALVGKYVEANGSEMLKDMVKQFAEELMDSEANALCSADFGKRVNRRNGYQEREWDTRAGTVTLEMPKLREAVTFSSGSWSHGDVLNGC
jgi:transposase-like protein